MHIREELKQVLEQNGWHYAENDDLLKVDVEGSNGNWASFCKCLEEQCQFLYYSVCPSRVPEGKRKQMALALTRMNYGFKIGNFEMDLDSGEIHFKTSIQFSEEIEMRSLIRQVIISNILAMDEYLPMVMKIMFSDADEKTVAEWID